MIVVAGGSGTRMGADLPKQFIELNGKPILMYTLKNLHESDAELELVLVLPKDQQDNWRKLCAKHGFDVSHVIADGGDTRFQSVRNGLEKASKVRLIGVHDGVRPFVSAELVNRCFDAASAHGAAVPVTPVVQSLRKLKGEISEAVSREDYSQVQTPQCFRSDVLIDAYDSADRTDYSDDASVVEASGKRITLVDGDEVNIKITTPFDLKLAKLIIA